MPATRAMSAIRPAKVFAYQPAIPACRQQAEMPCFIGFHLVRLAGWQKMKGRVAPRLVVESASLVPV